LTPWLAAAAAVVVAFMVWSFWPREPSSLERGVAAYEAAVREARPSAYRLSGSGYAPPGVTRGGQRDRLEQARAHLEAAVAEDPTPEALRALARARLAAGDAAGAFEDLDRAYRTAPDDANIAVDRAIALAEQGRLAEARDALSAVLARDPRRADALFDRALVDERMGRRDDARQDWQRYLVVDSSSPWAEEVRRDLQRE
jgi:tetratricopeptide (TPR) repeat protein